MVLFGKLNEKVWLSIQRIHIISEEIVDNTKVKKTYKLQHKELRHQEKGSVNQNE